MKPLSFVTFADLENRLGPERIRSLATPAEVEEALRIAEDGWRAGYHGLCGAQPVEDERARRAIVDSTWEILRARSCMRGSMPQPFSAASMSRLLPLVVAMSDNVISPTVRARLQAAVAAPPSDTALWALLVELSRLPTTDVAPRIATLFAVDRFYAPPREGSGRATLAEEQELAMYAGGVQVPVAPPAAHACRVERARQLVLGGDPLAVRCMLEDGGCDADPLTPCVHVPTADPVLAAIARARLRPPLPEPERQRMVALDAEAASDSAAWPPFDGLRVEVAALAPSGDPKTEDPAKKDPS